MIFKFIKIFSKNKVKFLNYFMYHLILTPATTSATPSLAKSNFLSKYLPLRQSICRISAVLTDNSVLAHFSNIRY